MKDKVTHCSHNSSKYCHCNNSQGLIDIKDWSTWRAKIWLTEHSMLRTSVTTSHVTWKYMNTLQYMVYHKYIAYTHSPSLFDTLGPKLSLWNRHITTPAHWNIKQRKESQRILPSSMFPASTSLYPAVLEVSTFSSSDLDFRTPVRFRLPCWK